MSSSKMQLQLITLIFNNRSVYGGKIHTIHFIIYLVMITVYSAALLIHAECHKTDNVFPMIPAGAALEDMLIEPPKQKMAKPVGST